MAYCQMCADKEVEISSLRKRVEAMEKVVEAAKECVAGTVHPDGLRLPPAIGDWDRLCAALRALEEGG